MPETGHRCTDSTWFEKKAKGRWAWIAQYAKTNNEIEFVSFDKRRMMRNIAVGSSFSADRVHRLVGARLAFEGKIEKKALQIANHRQRSNVFEEAMHQARIFSEYWSLQWSCEDDDEKFTAKL
ncbi:unnamed protein product [Soboliphyme baturini]|uniref:Transposase n=1 Tax=Soboliphyme baturini TaxID=241478 RepID=A0A183IUE3_9BILA|nr:unnamed protein product [Soboliphyme baturini]